MKIPMLRDTLWIGLIFCLFIILLALPMGASAANWLQMGKDLLGTAAKPSATGVVSGLSDSDIAAGLKDALRVGTESVVGQLGTVDGFNADKAIHIPLPDKLETVRKYLAPLGMSGMLDDLELKLNRAAEQATPPAKQLFWDSIESMTLDDVQKIYSGPDDAATRYFEGKMSPPLSEAMKPIVDSALADVGAVQSYDALMGQYKSIPFVPDVKADLSSYVIEKGMGGIFHYLAIEEAAIRNNPVKRTTDILQKVFGAR